MSHGRQIECWFLKFQSDVGIGRACNRTGNTANSRLWVRRVFPASLSCLEARRAKRSECWFLKFQSDVGIGGACNRTGNAANPRLGFGVFFLLPFFQSACFFLLPFFFKTPKLAVRGYKRRHTYDRASFRVLKGLTLFWA